MILGFNVYYDGSGTTPYYTSSFPRRGQAALFSVQATHFFGTSTLVVSVEHRNREDASWSGRAGPAPLHPAWRNLGPRTQKGGTDP